MLLAIDAGNTNITLGVFHDDKLLAEWRLTTDRLRTPDEYGVQVRNLFSLTGLDYKTVKAIVAVCVVPSLNFTLAGIAQKYFNLTPLFIDHSTDTGLKIHYDTPSDLGADRIVDAVAAVAKYGAPCIVIDFGTATTFNAINSAGEFLGGAISPGLMTSANALSSRIPNLPRVEFARPAGVIGHSTIAALQSGIYFGYAGLIDRLIEKTIESMGGSPNIIATGGLAVLVESASKYIDLIDQTLTLDGLNLVYERIKAANKP
jgi:type III pantothenate kinase